MTKRDNIPYPSEQEIERQVKMIVNKGLPEKKSFLHEITALYGQFGWWHLLPNRNEWLFTFIMMSSSFLFIWLTAINESLRSPTYFVLLFTLSPFIFASLSIFSIYEKKENQTYEVEMTTKYTVFQLIGLRMLLYSGLAILCNTSISLWLSHALNIEFFRIWLLSLTGLFIFATGLLMAMKSGQVISKLIWYVVGWVCVNSLLYIFADMHYVQFIVQLPVVIYGGLVTLLILTFSWAFKRMILRKQEGILC